MWLCEWHICVSSWIQNITFVFFHNSSHVRQSAQENKITKHVVIVVVGLHGYALSVSDTSHQRNLSVGWDLCEWNLSVFPCLLGFSLGASPFPPQSKDMYVWWVCWLYSRWWCESVCVCLSVLALWWLGTTVYPVFCLLTDGIDCRYAMT